MKMRKLFTQSVLLTCGVAGVLMLCLTTFFIVSAGSQNFSFPDFAKSFLLNLPFCILLTLLDIYIIRFTLRFERLSPALKLVVDLIITGIIVVTASFAVNWILSNTNHVDFISQIMTSLLVGALILLCVELYMLGIRHSNDAKRLLEIEKEKARYQYEALKNQINPHFLFNCMNVMASLVYEDPDRANMFAKRLSNVYRYLLTTRTKNIVSVADELKFTNDYVFLQKIRFENNLKISIITSGTYDRRWIVPAAVQMSVENAIKHNVCNSMNPLEITIEITSDYITVSNRLNRIGGTAGTGTGIANLREQFLGSGRDIEITETATEFIVKLPYISGLTA